MKKKICILTSAHPKDDVRVYRKFALTLIQEFEVIWIGPDDYYFEKHIESDGIKRFLFKNQKGLIGRLLNNYKVLKRYLGQKNVDFVYIPDPDLAFFFTYFINSKNTKTIFDIHEVFHKDLLIRRVKGTFYPIFSNLIEKLIKKIVSRVDLTTGVSSVVLNYYVSTQKPYLVIRSCLPQSFVDYNSPNLGKKNIFTIVHGKNHISRGTKVVLDALEILKEKKIICKVLMISQNSNDEIFEEYVKNNGVSSFVELLDGLPFIEMQKQISQSHAGLIAYGRDLGLDSLPNRFFEYMAAGIPVIVPSFSNEMVKIVMEEQCGLFIDTEDPVKVAESFEYLINNHELTNKMGEKGKIAFLKSHNWEVEIKPLINYLISDSIESFENQ